MNSTGITLLTLTSLLTCAAAAPEIKGLARQSNGALSLTVPSQADSYYLLWGSGGATLEVFDRAAAIARGTGGDIVLSSGANTAPAVFYRVEQVPLTSTRDTDGDLMPDVFELTYPTCLNALDPNDAGIDCDSDGVSNYDEYRAGTDPSRPPATAGGLVINEVDYDQSATDTAEFVEIYCTSSTAVSLQGLSLVLVNGANSNEYRRVDLGAAGTIQPGQYLVIGPESVTVPAGALKLNFDVASDAVQNGAPDGLALVRLSDFTVLDALSYEGSITAANITGASATVSLVEGTALGASVSDINNGAGSLSRLPNGADTNDAATDWRFSSSPTPGAAN